MCGNSYRFGLLRVSSSYGRLQKYNNYTKRRSRPPGQPHQEGERAGGRLSYIGVRGDESKFMVHHQSGWPYLHVQCALGGVVDQ